jgi:hypothetical protein
MSRAMRTIVLLLAVLLAAAAPAANAKDVHAGSLDLVNPWARATPKGAPVAAGYVTIKNNGATADRLVGGSSDAAAKVEVHEMSMDNGVMKMRPITGGLEIKPGATVELKPQGLHLMLIKPKNTLKQGDHVKVTLQFEKAGNVELDFDVTGMGGPAAGHGTPGMKM